MREPYDRFEAALVERGIGDEFMRTIMSQCQRHNLDPDEYLMVATEIIESVRPPREIGGKQWRLEVMSALKLYRETGERPSKSRKEVRMPPPAKTALKRIECNKCGGTGWRYMNERQVVKCECRLPSGRAPQIKKQAAKLDGRREQTTTLSFEPNETIIMNMIRARGIDNPVKIAEIADETGLSQRAVKQVVHDLRVVHLFPIGASRGPRAGYYWARTWKDWEPYVNQYKSQALEELKIIYRVTRKNWPTFAGQLKLDFEMKMGE